MRERKIATPEVEYLLGRGYRARPLEDLKGAPGRERRSRCRRSTRPRSTKSSSSATVSFRGGSLNELRTGRGARG